MMATARYNCDRLVWFERHGEITRAIAREKELNGWRRAKKIALIESLKPTWTDWSLDWYEYEPVDYKRALDRMEPRSNRRSFRCASRNVRMTALWDSEGRVIRAKFRSRGRCGSFELFGKPVHLTTVHCSLPRYGLIHSSTNVVCWRNKTSATI